MAVPVQVVLTGAFAIAKGAEDKLESVVLAHGRFVYQITYAVLRNRQDAEDAAQETFLRLLRQRKRLGEIQDLRGWLARIAWRVAVDRSRRRFSMPWNETEAAQTVALLCDRGAGAEQIAAGKEMMALLQSLISVLPRELREAIMLSTVEELSGTEIAAMLDIPEAMVRTRLFRARRILRERLAVVLEGKHES